MSKTFTQAELLKLSEKEKEVQKQMDNGADGRENVARAAQFRADAVQAMWQRVLARLAAEGAPK